MSTLTRRRTSLSQTHSSNQTASTGINAAIFEAACAAYEIQSYSSGEALYELIRSFGEVIPSNTLDSAFQSFPETKLGLQPGEAGFSYSAQYNRFSMAMRLKDGSIAFAGLLHDQNGTPRVDEFLQLCWVRAARDFDLEGDTLITKGQEFIKALPTSYVNHLKKAA